MATDHILCARGTSVLRLKGLEGHGIAVVHEMRGSSWLKATLCGLGIGAMTALNIAGQPQALTIATL
jgi:hypothetical protein